MSTEVFQVNTAVFQLKYAPPHTPDSSGILKYPHASVIMSPKGELLVSHSVSVQKVTITSDQSYWRRQKCRPSLYEPTSPLFNKCIHTVPLTRALCRTASMRMEPSSGMDGPINAAVWWTVRASAFGTRDASRSHYCHVGQLGQALRSDEGGSCRTCRHP